MVTFFSLDLPPFLSPLFTFRLRLLFFQFFPLFFLGNALSFASFAIFIPFFLHVHRRHFPLFIFIFFSFSSFSQIFFFPPSCRRQDLQPPHYCLHPFRQLIQPLFLWSVLIYYFIYYFILFYFILFYFIYSFYSLFIWIIIHELLFTIRRALF